MKMLELQEKLRAAIWSRIHRGELTGLALARDAGFQQAHLSNFLNSRRGLSLDSMDRLLDALHLGILDLVEMDEIRRRANPVSTDNLTHWPVAVVSHENASSARFVPEQILDTLSFKKSFLQGLKPNPVGDRGDWERFVLIKADAATSKAMAPRVSTGSLLLIDRHYNSLQPYRRSRSNMYAVRFAAGCSIRYVSVTEDRLILRAHQREFPVELLCIERGRIVSDYLVGRVCHVSVEV